MQHFGKRQYVNDVISKRSQGTASYFNLTTVFKFNQLILNFKLLRHSSGKNIIIMENIIWIELMNQRSGVPTNTADNIIQSNDHHTTSPQNAPAEPLQNLCKLCLINSVFF